MPTLRPFALCTAVVLCIAAHPQRAQAHAQLPSETWCEAGAARIAGAMWLPSRSRSTATDRIRSGPFGPPLAVLPWQLMHCAA